MKKLRKLIKQGEKGAALVWVAGSLVVLLSMAALATDLGWILLSNSRLQSAADAASLAGVVNLPSFPSGATSDAQLASASNGFAVPSEATLTDAILDDNSYRVTLETDVNTFFLRLIGFDTFHLNQSATAQYIKPVKMGSKDNVFGDPDDFFWAAINAEYTEIQQGDPYAARCENLGCTQFTSPCVADDFTGWRSTCYRPGGYYYAVDVPANVNGLNIEIYDGGHFLNPISNTLDRSWQPSWGGVQLEYKLFEPDASPSNPTDNTAVACDRSFPNPPGGSGHFNTWGGVSSPYNCSISGSITPGIWVLQFPSPQVEGATKFGIRATSGSGPPHPAVYGMLDMSLYVNYANSTASPSLAEVRPEHANRDLLVSIWDLGDVSGAASIEFKDNNGHTPQCTWDSSNSVPAGGGTCLIDISSRKYNAAWLYVTIPIPQNYVCDPAPGNPPNPSASTCWWTVNLISQQPTDRTTWAVQITGDPVRLTD